MGERSSDSPPQNTRATTPTARRRNSRATVRTPQTVPRNPHAAALGNPRLLSPATSARRGDESCVPPAAFRAVLLSLRTGGLTGAERAKVKADEKTGAKAAGDKKAAQEMTNEVGMKEGFLCGCGDMPNLPENAYNHGRRGCTGKNTFLCSQIKYVSCVSYLV